MLGSRILDTAIGLVFVFLIASLICSVIQELIATVLSWRARTLKQGLMNMLGEWDRRQTPAGEFLAGLRNFGVGVFKRPRTGEIEATRTPFLARLYDHGLIRSLTKNSRLPSYIPSRNFALAMINMIGLDAVTAGQTIEDHIRAAKLPERLETTLISVVAGTAGDLEKIRQALEQWFDGVMDRVTGWYRRWCQGVTLALGLLLAIGFNIDALKVATALWNDAVLRGAAADAAHFYVESHKDEFAGTGEARTTPETNLPTATTEGTEDAKSAGDQGKFDAPEFANRLNKLNAELNSLQLPIGWRTVPQGSAALLQLAAALPGWLIMALAVSLGAQFWFKLLGDLLKLRSSGSKPG